MHLSAHCVQGEAAKKTVQLAFEKIRSLQQDFEAKCQVGGME